MPRLRRNAAHARWDRTKYWIAAVGWDFFSVYESQQEQRREDYLEVEAELLDAYMRECPGRRPRAWWWWTACESQPDWEYEPERLAELGVLTDEEIAAIAEHEPGWQPPTFDNKRWAKMMAGEATG